MCKFVIKIKQQKDHSHTNKSRMWYSHTHTLFSFDSEAGRKKKWLTCDSYDISPKVTHELNKHRTIIIVFVPLRSEKIEKWHKNNAHEKRLQPFHTSANICAAGFSVRLELCSVLFGSAVFFRSLSLFLSIPLWISCFYDRFNSCVS